MRSGRPQLLRPDAMFRAARSRAASAAAAFTPFGVEEARNDHRSGVVHRLELRRYAPSLHGASATRFPALAPVAGMARPSRPSSPTASRIDGLRRDAGLPPWIDARPTHSASAGGGAGLDLQRLSDRDR